MTTVKTSADPSFVDLRDDLLFQSAKSDGKGWFELPNMRDLAPRGWPPTPPEPMVRKPAAPDSRDAIIAELVEALEAAKELIQEEHDTRREAWDDSDPYVLGPRLVLDRIAAALRRARGQG